MMPHGRPGWTEFHQTPIVQDCEFTYSCNNPAFAVKADTKAKARAKMNITVSIANGKEAVKHGGNQPVKHGGNQSKHAMLTIACPAQTSCKWCYYLEQS
jgi:hypothetical protein